MISKMYAKSFGALPLQEDVRDFKLRKLPTQAEVFPEEFELYHPPVKNQGWVGSCVAHSIAEAGEYFNKKQLGAHRDFSTGFIYGNRRNSVNKKSGMYVREALHNMCKYGTPFNEYFDENVEVPEAIQLFEERFEEMKDRAFPNRISTYFRLTSDADIKRALMNYGPVVFAMDWREDSSVDSEGVLRVNPKAKKEGGHCMIIYGWNEKGWLIQNSWGIFWGDNGCAILPYDVKKTEAWGITDEVIDETDKDIKRPYNTTFLKWIAKIFNWFLNLFRRKK